MLPPPPAWTLIWAIASRPRYRNCSPARIAARCSARSAAWDKPRSGERRAGKKCACCRGVWSCSFSRHGNAFEPATASGRVATAKTGLRRPSDQLRRLFSDLRRLADDLRRASDDLRRPSDDLRRPFSTCDGLRTTCDACFSSCDGQKTMFLVVLPIGDGQKATVEVKPVRREANQSS